MDRVRLSNSRIRSLDTDDLGIQLPPTSGSDWGGSTFYASSSGNEPPPLPSTDELFSTTKDLLKSYGGVILVGPSGTSKSYMAARLAQALAGSSTRVRFVQFHPSYQYEDFVQGFVPRQAGGFELKAKHLMEMAQAAVAEPDLIFVLVIDELSRGDAARIFGEGLTYVERTKRGLTFSLASGDEFAIPDNLAFIATMNPLDRGVDEVDAAFERRFAKVPMDPNVATLEGLLEASGLDERLRRRVIGFFRFVNKHAQENPQTALGHTFFLGVGGIPALQRLWEHQLRFFFEKAYRLDPHGHREVIQQWQRVVEGASASEETQPESEAGHERALVHATRQPDASSPVAAAAGSEQPPGTGLTTEIEES
jgi:5-methylcytosine-specific restriction protein B